MGQFKTKRKGIPQVDLKKYKVTRVVPTKIAKIKHTHTLVSSGDSGDCPPPQTPAFFFPEGTVPNRKELE